MKKAPLLFALAALAASAASIAQAQAAPPAAPIVNRFAATIEPAERFESGGLLVERHGSRGRPVILVPGLASGPWVWQETIRQFKDEFTLYVVTLPGFDGRPAPGATSDWAPFEGARAALRGLIAERKLDKPVIVGHSLGGTLAYAVAQDLGNGIGGVVALDGLPVFPGTENMPPQQRPQAAINVRNRMAASRPDAYTAEQRQYMRGQGVLDIGKADDITPLLLRSDREAVGAYVADLLALDLRPGLSKISAPVLVVAPFYQYDAAQDALTVNDKVEHYRMLVDGTPSVEVVPIAPSRHFLMIDQPLALAGILRRYFDRR
ncbi:alpha/beta fold hydrolase [Massilia timonae]|uniref:Alpha/beta hydrolase family protein n=1 Tax=Massilia timonae TaxID=47229 RepID=A0A1S2NDH2_9BURK|nr:alpha/beta hydrolase [Massilia timonae]OIJ43146.1 alpha/beta hydrolase family protein [Massilia timonae]